MNTDDILDALNEIDDTSIKKAREPRKKISRKALWISVGATAAACLAVVLLLPQISHMIQHGALCDCTDHKISPTAAIAADYREYKSFALASKSAAIYWDWDHKTTAGRFSTITYNNAEYFLQRSYLEEEMTVSASFIGEKLATVTAEGYDRQNDITHTIDCTLYEIAGVNPARFLAVQYAGEENADACYVFHRHEFDPPATLGDFISDLNLTETFPLVKFTHKTYDYTTREKSSTTYGLSHKDSKVVWDMLSRYASVGTRTDENHNYENNRITFSATSEALGLYNRSFTLTADGYLSTNIDDYGYDFYLGEEAVTELREYILAHKTEAPKEDIETLYGIVSEIGEDYIKIDDSTLMKNPEDGLEFTVYAHDMAIKRYIISGRLKTGDHVLIKHRGISFTEPPVVTTAFFLEKGGFIFEEEESVKDYPSKSTPTPEVHVLE